MKSKKLIFYIFIMAINFLHIRSEGYACSNNICQNEGKCIPITITYGQCLCKDGFTGRDCGSSISNNHQNNNFQTQPYNPINLPNPCLMGCQNGQCMTIAPTVTQCVCKPQYTGKYCENSLIPSQGYYHPQQQNQQPCNCQNSGRCVEIMPQLPPSCICAQGFSGRYCENTIRYHYN